MKLRQRLSDWLPQRLLPAARRLSPGRIRYAPAAGDWETARAISSGYDSAGIVERVAAATREVIAGRAAFERDSMTFARPDYCLPLLAALLRAAAVNGGHLEVLDFGGSLGSLYWQYRGLLQGLASLRWQVVEQPAFVELGRREFTLDALSFADSLATVAPPRVPALLLAGSVLQYLPEPDRVLDEWLHSQARWLVLDRMPLTEFPQHRLYVQQVPEYLYRASYPCWMLSAPRLRAALRGWNTLYEYDSLPGELLGEDWQPFRYRGLACERPPA